MCSIDYCREKTTLQMRSRRMMKSLAMTRIRGTNAAVYEAQHLLYNLFTFIFHINI